MNNINRKESHKKHEDLERIFPELELILGSSEEELLKAYSNPAKKVYLIVGCARSGSTLLYQYLAKTGYFMYPTNFLSRFYYAPYIGYRLQQALIDFDLKGEVFQNLDALSNFKSNLGKTKGPKQPHEFWYFWNRFFKFKNLQQLSQKEMKDVNWSLFLKELHALEEASNRPILLKAMNLNWNLADLEQNIPNVHFIYIKRDVLYNAQSLLIARKNFYGNYDEWYSFKTPNYYSLKKSKPTVQVIEQVLANNKAVENSLKSVKESNKTIISYSDFCNNPNNLITDLNSKNANIIYKNSDLSFENGNNIKIDSLLYDEMLSYLTKIK
ncbi:hypothetical protein A9Q93_03505 [Nonlabens dokdonensis]|uniref:Sulfotransferase family protein n=1 Tax=Nonlabens dokdonensis TaxID=328515 RepID=A0A1Z8B7X3_9FLAO|nr:sulfotransferase [Nonlabens dokdonensis]OUS18696.1 hypothetical protein A9Q93_03505 [Nonlabens dokdonensis]